MLVVVVSVLLSLVAGCLWPKVRLFSWFQIKSTPKASSMLVLLLLLLINSLLCSALSAHTFKLAADRIENTLNNKQQIHCRQLALFRVFKQIKSQKSLSLLSIPSMERKKEREKKERRREKDFANLKVMQIQSVASSGNTRCVCVLLAAALIILDESFPPPALLLAQECAQSWIFRLLCFVCASNFEFT